MIIHSSQSFRSFQAIRIDAIRTVASLAIGCAVAVSTLAFVIAG